MTIRWRTIAIGSLLFNLAAIAVVSTVAVTNNAGALNTVALSLAVIAFVCQLIVYTVQTWQGSEQLRRAEDLYSATAGLISDARVRIEDTHTMVQSQHQEMLRLSREKDSIEALKNHDVDPGELEGGDSESDLQEPAPITAPLPVAESTPSVSLGAPKPDLASDEAFRVTRVRRFPPAAWPKGDEDMSLALRKLEEVPDGSYFNFCIAVVDYVRSRIAGSAPGLSHNMADQPLIDSGLLEELPSQSADDYGARQVVLSEIGRSAGSLLLAPWPPPASYGIEASAVVALRTKIPDNLKPTFSAISRDLTPGRPSVS
ncbi:hypothetical protein [Aeromicrobium sp. Leaf350]|uniref:hypothetical protein n=1 Tax=Aeromicrobium sp. Leaf350 TaxID=2876565 RepID=UPI001E2A55B7|nr:hypothetical protein [Aeromicrobium sp. Leaf350]